MNKILLGIGLLVVMLTAAASAQPAGVSAAPGGSTATATGGAAATSKAEPGSSGPAAGGAPATGSADLGGVAAGSAAPSAGSGGTVGASATPPAAKSPRELCAEAMNADPTFAQAIVATLNAKNGKTLDEEIVKAHEDANQHVEKNERHVILAYAAMWVIAALFVLFLWRRQQALIAEIAVLRKDLEAAAKEPK